MVLHLRVPTAVQGSLTARTVCLLLCLLLRSLIAKSVIWGWYTCHELCLSGLFQNNLECCSVV